MTQSLTSSTQSDKLPNSILTYAYNDEDRLVAVSMLGQNQSAKHSILLCRNTPSTSDSLSLEVFQRTVVDDKMTYLTSLPSR